MPPNMSTPHRRSGSSPSAGLLPTITSSLRSVMMYNHNALTQAISQIEAIGEIQTELVNARSAHARASEDLQIYMERNAIQGRQLQKAQDDLRVATQNLHGAREQLNQLESKLAAVSGKSLPEQGAQNTRIQALESALSGANQLIAELTRKLQMATSAAIAAQHSDNPIIEEDALTRSKSRVQELERQLPKILGLPEQDLTMTTEQLVETLTGSNANVTPGEVGQQKMQVFAHFKAISSEFDGVLKAAFSYGSRNTMLEATIKTIKDLHVNVTPTVTRPTVAEIRTTIDREPPPKDSPVEEIEMDIERTEAARVARQNSIATLSAQPQSTTPQRPPSIQPPDAARSVGMASSTPTQPTFFPQHTQYAGSPQRKRQRTLTSEGTPEPLPRDDMLHVYIRLVTTTYKVQSVEGASTGENTPAEQKQLVCKLCETRHKDQPDFPVTVFPYDRDTLITVPSLADAESTRMRVQPWIDHIQQKHQKMYSAIMERKKPRSSTTASASPAS